MTITGPDVSSYEHGIDIAITKTSAESSSARRKC